MNTKLKPIEIIFLLLLVAYGALFLDSISEYWFNPLYTTDDSRQQAYPLWRVVFPDAFPDDPVTKSMMGYLSPLHWWISYAITMFTESPVMTGHYVMLIQLTLTLFFLYKLVSHYAGTVPACFSLIWYLHTRNLPMRMTVGLPRGWGGLIIVAFLYYLAKKNYNLVLLSLLLGILTNPPAAFVCALTYGLFLGFDFLREKKASPTFRPFVIYLCLTPVFLFVATTSLSRPPEFGEMASLAEAEANPAFFRAGGRFPFVPLKAPWDELSNIGIQAFINRWEKRGAFTKGAVTTVALFSVMAIFLFDAKRGRELIPRELKYFFGSIMLTYFLSRFLAFKLYVPDRHLQFPLNTFWIVALTIAIWRGVKTDRGIGKPVFALLALAGVLYFLGGTGLKGEANFNTKTDDRQWLYNWIRLTTRRDAVIAGDPSSLDGLQLFAIRTGYITNETAHPFYSGYWALAKSRLERSFKMYFARNLEDFKTALNGEKIDYFVFDRRKFTKENLKRANYYRPVDKVLRKVIDNSRGEFFINELGQDKYKEAIVLDDGETVVINIAKLPES